MQIKFLKANGLGPQTEYTLCSSLMETCGVYWWYILIPSPPQTNLPSLNNHIEDIPETSPGMVLFIFNKEEQQEKKKKRDEEVYFEKKKIIY